MEASMPEIGDRWIITQGSWFADKLNLQPSQVYDTLGLLIQESFAEASSAYLPTATISGVAVYDSLPLPESHRIDTRVYVKGRFPAQGQTIQIDGYSPPTLILVHEVTLGPDLSRDLFYDLKLSNRDTESRKSKVKNLTAIVSWTLWDNHRQRILLSGISETMVPWEKSTGGVLLEKLKNLVKKLPSQMNCQISGRCQ